MEAAVGHLETQLTCHSNHKVKVESQLLTSGVGDSYWELNSTAACGSVHRVVPGIGHRPSPVFGMQIRFCCKKFCTESGAVFERGGDVLPV